jgi:hypothetical protein
MRFIRHEDLSWQPEVIPQNERWEPVALTVGDRAIALMIGLAPNEDSREVMRRLSTHAQRAISASTRWARGTGLRCDFS